MDADKLAQEIDGHQLWLESQRLQGAQAVFRGQDLRFASLAGKRLNECVLADSNLERSDLHGVSLAGADLRKVNLAYANLSGADLSGANLSGARLEGAILDNAELREALIEDAVFDSASVKNANFSGARGTRAKFNRADLSAADLDAAVLQDGQFNGANMTQVSLRETNLDRAQMRGAALSGAQFDGTSLRDALLLEAILVGVNFESSNIEGARLDRNVLGGVDPEDADEDGNAKPQQKTSAQRPFSGAALEPNVQMARLLRRRDELQQLIRTRIIHGKHDSSQASSDADLAGLRLELDAVEGERRVLRQEIRRSDEHSRNAQAELQGRVEAAATALRSALGFTNKQLRRAFIWSLVTKTWGIALIGAGVGWLAFYMARTSLNISSDLSAWATTAAVMFVGGFALLILDFLSARHVRPLVERREKLENVMAALNASLHLSVDVEANQRNILETFEAARKVLLASTGNALNGEQN